MHSTIISFKLKAYIRIKRNIQLQVFCNETIEQAHKQCNRISLHREPSWTDTEWLNKWRRISTLGHAHRTIRQLLEEKKYAAMYCLKRCACVFIALRSWSKPKTEYYIFRSYGTYLLYFYVTKAKKFAYSLFEHLFQIKL